MSSMATLAIFFVSILLGIFVISILQHDTVFSQITQFFSLRPHTPDSTDSPHFQRARLSTFSAFCHPGPSQNACESSRCGCGAPAMYSICLDRHLVTKRNVRRLPWAEKEQKSRRILCVSLWNEVERKGRSNNYNNVLGSTSISHLEGTYFKISLGVCPVRDLTTILYV